MGDCRCQVATDRDGGLCAELHPGGLKCTEPPGHDGPHKACGVSEESHPITSWTQEGEIPNGQSISKRPHLPPHLHRLMGVAAVACLVTIAVVLGFAGRGGAGVLVLLGAVAVAVITEFRPRAGDGEGGA